MNRRNFIGRSAAIILTPGLLMPVKAIAAQAVWVPFSVRQGILTMEQWEARRLADAEFWRGDQWSPAEMVAMKTRGGAPLVFNVINLHAIRITADDVADQPLADMRSTPLGYAP